MVLPPVGILKHLSPGKEQNCRQICYVQ